MNLKSISFYLSLFCFPISFLAFINILYASYFDYFLSIDTYFATLLSSLIIGLCLMYYGKKSKKNKFGTLFKSSATGKSASESMADQSSEHGVFENSDEYWNDERAKLGLKPLRK